MVNPDALKNSIEFIISTYLHKRKLTCIYMVDEIGFDGSVIEAI
jgi:hypothetical protein